MRSVKSSLPLARPTVCSQALRHELAQAVYLNVPVVILPAPRNRALVADYARAVNSCLAAGGPFGQVSIRIPISDPAELTHPIPNSRSTSSLPSRASASTSARLSTAQTGIADPSATWEIWDVIRTMCGYNPRLSLSEWWLPAPSGGPVVLALKLVLPHSQLSTCRPLFLPLLVPLLAGPLNRLGTSSFLRLPSSPMRRVTRSSPKPPRRSSKRS